MIKARLVKKGKRIACPLGEGAEVVFAVLTFIVLALVILAILTGCTTQSAPAPSATGWRSVTGYAGPVGGQCVYDGHSGRMVRVAPGKNGIACDPRQALNPPAGPVPSPIAPVLNWECRPGSWEKPYDTSWGEYSLVVTNPSSQAVQVTGVAVIFYAAGQEIGSDDPATEYGYQTGGFSTVLIGAYQTITIPMQSQIIANSGGYWSCLVGQWWHE